jgi:YebC/PmpR family DNA-binding regulatory protein
MSTVVEPPLPPPEAADADVEALDVAELVAPPDDALLELLELDDPQPARSATTTGSARREARFMSGRLPVRAMPSPLNWIDRMSGHSKWHSIKHKKAVVDARRGQHFTKLARAITVAAREGGGDPDGNPSLALAVQKARDASMPKDNIERAIAKGTGEGVDAEAFETVLYEGYGPGGVALLIEALTDNRNRTGADVRHLLGKHGGNLGEPGSVSYLFDKQGVIVVDASRYDEDDLMPAIDAGALDIAQDEDVLEVVTEPSDLTSVRQALTDAGVEIESADLTQRPRVRVPVEEADAAKLLKLIDALEESDDVGAVHANFDVDADVLERIAG